MNVVALIPARSGSVGLKNKNIKIFNGKPLIYYAIKSAKQSKLINDIIVSSDSEKILNISKKYGATTLLRPKKYATSKSTDLDVIKNLVENLEKKIDILVFLRPTNPFRTGKDIDSCINKIFEDDFSSIRSVSNCTYPPYWLKTIKKKYLRDLYPKKLSEKRRQDLPEVYMANGAIEVIGSKVLSKLKNRFGNKVGYYFMPNICAYDIDDYVDFRISEYLFKNFFYSIFKNNKLNDKK
jgi:CMP-N,N'-diacetyllegionaminic acid synthase